MENPLLSLKRPLPFAEIQAEHVVPAVRELIADAETRLAAITAEHPTYESTLGELESSSERLELAVGLVEHLESVATTSALREAYNAILPDVTAFWSSIALRENVWQALLAFANTAEAAALDPTRRRLLEKTLADFRRNGANLGPDDKERLRAVDRDLGLLTNKFSQNVLDSTNAFELVVEDPARLAGMPESAIDAAKASAASKGKSGYRLTLQAPSVVAVLTYADDPALRETLWRAHNTRALDGDHDNRLLIGRILELRRRKAELLGFRDFADLVTEDRMAKTGERARAFIDELANKTQAAFERENRELTAFRKQLEGPNAPALSPWDVAYYAEKLRHARYDLDEEELRQYFAADRVLSGAFLVAERLFGVKIEPVQNLSVWDPEIRAYQITEAGGRRLGTFYVDPYPRENKRGGAWMHGLVTSVPPVEHAAVFCANVNPPVGEKPSLLTHRDVETIFHEFGHLLHHCLSSVSVRSLACTRVAQDFVELPSQIMENWCSEREALNLFASHYETGETIPAHLLERLRAARTFRAASAQMRQLGFAAADLALHVEYDPARDGDVMAYARRVLERYSPTPLPPEYGMLAGFLHLFGAPVGYAAGYYSYKWAEVLDADAFGRFRVEGVLNAEVGRDFREKILARGDSQDPMELFVSFMGREPRPEALLERQGLAA
jgi:oligopeptidase A